MRTHEHAAATMVETASRLPGDGVDESEIDPHEDTQQAGESESHKASIPATALALRTADGAAFDGRLVLRSRESDLQVGGLHVHLLAQKMAYDLAGDVLAHMAADADFATAEPSWKGRPEKSRDKSKKEKGKYRPRDMGRDQKTDPYFNDPEQIASSYTNPSTSQYPS
jgi:hypothetical protein